MQVEDPSARIVAAVRSRGSNASNLRDAAHEACHALDAKLRGRWERERLHSALERHCGDHGTMIYYEMRARAVEALCCEQIEGNHDVQHWALICWMETIKTMRIELPSVQWIVEQITQHKKRSATICMAERIKALPVARTRRAL